MATFRIQIFYERGASGKWSNVWHLDSDTLIDARQAAVTFMVPPLLELLDPSCTLVKVLASDPATDDFSEQAIGEVGIFPDAGGLLPLWNSIKVQFQPADLGRPDIKFLKGILGENITEDGALGTVFAALVDSTLTTMLADLLGGGSSLCSENGAQWGDVAVNLPIQMRQMHRRRRRTVP